MPLSDSSKTIARGSRASARRSRPRGFAWKILFVHALLMAAVLALVVEAALQIYAGTRTEEQLQAKTRQELLADQTRRGIEEYYQSVLEDLKWLQLSAKLGSNNEYREQLDERVSAVFYYDRSTGRVASILPGPTAVGAADISPDIHDWLGSVNGDDVSRFVRLGGVGVSLVATPVTSNVKRLLVAVVPGSKIESEWLPLLTDQNGLDATLLDEHLAVITSSSRMLLGANLFDFENIDLREMASDYLSHHRPMSRVFDQPLAFHGGSISPRLITITPVEVAGGEWALLLAAPLDSIDANVSHLLKTAVTWGGFVAISVAAILVSTGIQLIRYRGRVERVRIQALDRELTQAREIQLTWLPQRNQTGASIDIAAVNHPASHISGDFYNWFKLQDGRQVVVIGDVSGHGLTAAFLMATTQLLVHTNMTRLGEVGPAMEEVNRQLSSQKFHGQFVTMLIMVIDLENDRIEVASAGHPLPLISEGGRAPRLMDVQTQFAIGLDETIRYSTQVLTLRGATQILLYTDGVTDALGPNGERYSTEQLLGAMKGPFASTQGMIDGAIEPVNQFRASQELEDDLTLVAIELHDIAAPARSSSAALNV